MIYIDFDGVILDTEVLLFEEWRKNPNRFNLPEIEKIKYIQNADWNFIINNAEIINDSVYNLKQMDPNNTTILTKIHSLNNEGIAKIEWLRKMEIKQSIITVPYQSKKTDLVDASGNILIDDCLANLDDWSNNNGNPIFFDMDNDNYDSWNEPNTKNYPKVLSLSKFK
ncbi:MAG: hypothetical protein E7160_00035 [Firmicutes bacterium]|nr:hypothetical protein [Bacillota bacterium]